MSRNIVATLVVMKLDGITVVGKDPNREEPEVSFKSCESKSLSNAAGIAEVH